MTRRDVVERVAEAVFRDEREAAEMLGHRDAGDLVCALRAMAGVFEIASAPDKPAVWPRGSEPR